MCGIEIFGIWVSFLALFAIGRVITHLLGSVSSSMSSSQANRKNDSSGQSQPVQAKGDEVSDFDDDLERLLNEESLVESSPIPTDPYDEKLDDYQKSSNEARRERDKRWLRENGVE